MLEMHNTMIHGIFRPADALRETLREYAFCIGHTISFYVNQWDVLSRIPKPHCVNQTVIAARPEHLSSEGRDALCALLGADTTHFVLWLDRQYSLNAVKDYIGKPHLHIAGNIREFDAILKRLDGLPQPAETSPDTVTNADHLAEQREGRDPALASAHYPRIRPISVSQDELNALQGANR